MQRKHLVKDSIGATIAVFVVMALFAYIPFNFKILDPIKHGLKDFDFSDIYFSKIKQKSPIDTNIVIVNIGYNNRLQLAEQLQTIKKHQPAVIAFDVLFRSHKDAIIDSILEAEINSTPNLVMAEMLAGEGEGHDFNEVDTTALKFKNKKWGYINFIGKDERYPVRYYKPFYKLPKGEENSFAAAIVKQYNADAYQTLQNRHKEIEIINYSRRQEDYIVIDAHQLNDETFDLSVLKGKIVLMGFLGPDIETKVLEENRFTPMNDKFSGKAFPDMYGVVIHANIISSALEGKYINKLPTWLSMLIAFVVCFVHIFFFIKYYVNHHKFYHLVTKIIQLLTFVLMIYGSFMFLSSFGLKIEMGALLGSIALSVDVIYFYDGFVTWLHEKYGYKTVFGHH